MTRADRIILSIVVFALANLMVGVTFRVASAAGDFSTSIPIVAGVIWAIVMLAGQGTIWHKHQDR